VKEDNHFLNSQQYEGKSYRPLRQKKPPIIRGAAVAAIGDGDPTSDFRNIPSTQNVRRKKSKKKGGIQGRSLYLKKHMTGQDTSQDGQQTPQNVTLKNTPGSILFRRKRKGMTSSKRGGDAVSMFPNNESDNNELFQEEDGGGRQLSL